MPRARLRLCTAVRACLHARTRTPALPRAVKGLSLALGGARGRGGRRRRGMPAGIYRHGGGGRRRGPAPQIAKSIGALFLSVVRVHYYSLCSSSRCRWRVAWFGTLVWY